MGALPESGEAIVAEAYREVETDAREVAPGQETLLIPSFWNDVQLRMQTLV